MVQCTILNYIEVSRHNVIEFAKLCLAEVVLGDNDICVSGMGQLRHPY